MKKTTLILLCSIFISINSNAQSGEGVGLFRLGTSMSNIIDSIGYDTIRIFEDPLANWLDYKTIYLLDPNGDYYQFDKEISYKWMCLYLKSFSISGIEVKDIKLTFFNDTLIKYSSNSSAKLEEALTIKYGSPKDSISQKPIKCTGVYTGAKLDRVEIFQTREWRNGKFKLNALSNIYYNSKCEENFISAFYYQDNKGVKLAEMQSKIDDIKGKKEAEKKAKKRDSLKGF